MILQFFSNTGTVSGSMIWLDFEGFAVLVECGLHSGAAAECARRDRVLPFEPVSIHSVVISRACPACCGNIPSLVKRGFNGTVYTTQASRDLCSAALRGTALTLEEEAAGLNAAAKGGAQPAEPLYTTDDAEFSLYSFNGLNYHRTFHILRDLRCTFLDAGNLLGSAIVVLDAKTEEGQKRIVYTGELGRAGHPVLRPPEVPNQVTTLILKAGFGHKTHEAKDLAEKRLLGLVRRTIQKGGRIIAPGPSVGSALLVVNALHRLWAEKMVAPFQLYVDSPLAVHVSEGLRHHAECFPAEVRARFLTEEDPFGFGRLQYLRSAERSEQLAASPEPCMIIAPAEDCNSGPAQRHLRAALGDPRNMILFTNEMPKGTPAQRLQAGEKTVRILGEEVKVAAEVARVDAFNGIADREELLNFVNLVRDSSPDLSEVYVLPEGLDPERSFVKALEKEIRVPVKVPSYGESFGI